jgi:hypothetical protein
MKIRRKCNQMTKKDRTTIVLVGLASTPKADKRPRGTHTQKNRKNIADTIFLRKQQELQ